MFNATRSSFPFSPMCILNRAMSVGKNSTVIKIIRADVLPRFAEFLSKHGLPQLQVCSLPSISSFFFLTSLFSSVVYLVYFLQLETAWVLTNIAASDYTLLVAECGAVPRLVELLGSPNAHIRHQVKQFYLHSIIICVCVCDSLVCDIVGFDMLNRLFGVLEI